jgi:cysteinyl-tRNA synthetase
MPLRVFNYLTRALERFRPLPSERYAGESVRMVVGGPELRDHAHLGHARTYVALDVVVRYLRYCGYQVRHIRTYCDTGHPADGKKGGISAEALRADLGPTEVVESFLRSFDDDMDSLGVLRPNIAPRATCHISDTIAWIQSLIDRGYAYEADGNVTFSVERFPRYGELGRAIREEWGGDRVRDRSQGGDDLGDFRLWERVESPDALHWSSPWGQGAPARSIGCSVMAAKHLGPSFDIFGGDVEESTADFDREIALSEAHNEASFARYWLLVGSLRVNGKKMSRRWGNFLTIKDALRLYSPEAIRLFLLGTHYRSPLEFSRDAMQASQRGVNRLQRTAHMLQRRMRAALPSNGIGTAALADVASLEEYRRRFAAAMSADFNLPEALGVIVALVAEVDRALERGSQGVSLGTLSAMDKLLRDLAGGVLGLIPTDSASRLGGDLVADLVDYLLELRAQRREAKDWAGAEAICSRLRALGIAVSDGPFDTTWRLEQESLIRE